MFDNYLHPIFFQHEKNPWCEIVKAVFGLSNYTKNTILMKLLKDTKGFIPELSRSEYQKKSEELQVAIEAR